MSSALQKAIASVALSSAVALFVSLHALGDDFGWWRVRDMQVPRVELGDDVLSDRALPAPVGTVDMDFGLTNGLPASSYGRIVELARGLDHDPDKCYRYVRDNIAYASYYGLLKGPERTLLDREGNELDQAFLLLALLRASGFPGAGIGYSPLVVTTNDEIQAHFRVPLRRLESGSEYNAADWLGVDAGGSVADVAERVRTMHAFAGNASRIVTENGVPYLATEHFYVTLPSDQSTYLMDPAFKPSSRRPPSDAAADSGYSRSALLSAVGGTVAANYAVNLSKAGLAAYLDGLVDSLRGAWTNENAAASSFVGETAVMPQPSGDHVYYNGTLSVATADASVVQPLSADPVAMPDGAFYDAATDISIPGGTALNWTRHYDSRQRRRSGDMGFGWSHCFEASVVETSDPDAFLGGESVDSVLPTVAAQVVIDDMLADDWGACTAGAMARRWTVAAMAAQWWTERTTGAAAVVTLGSRSLRFSRRVDGTYSPPPGVTATLARRPSDGKLVLAERHGNTYTFNDDGRLLQIADSSGNITTLTYSTTSPDRLVRVENAFGANISVSWQDGRVSRVEDSAGRQVSYSYDSDGRLSSVVDVRGKTTTYTYDAAGRLLRQSSPAGTTSFDYNSAGLQSATTNALGGATLTKYDKAYNPVVASNMNGRALWTAYDGMDRIVAASNAIGKVRRFAYDPLSRRAALIRPSGAAERSVYDALGNHVACTNAEGRVFQMAYDALGRMTSATNAAGERVFAAEYDGVGNVVSRTDGAGRTTSFAYDPCDRLVSRTTADGGESFSYDLAGNLLSASNSIAVETFAYDLHDRLTNAVTRVGGSAFATSWARDAGGLVTNVAYGAGKTVWREYDAAGRLAAVRDWLGHEWTFSWNGLGLQTGGTSPGGTAHVFACDAYGNLAAWSVGEIAGRAIERDVEGRRLKDTVTAGPMPVAALQRNAENTFDAADRLVSATVAYDGAATPVTETFLYDGNGAMTNATSGGEAVFDASYDAQGRLASLGVEPNMGGPPSSAAAFSYDALGNRVSVGGHIFVPDHSDPLKRPLVECDADGNPIRYYIWGPGRLLGFIDPDDTLTVAHADEQGSVIALTDENAALLFRASYSPHGEDWGSSGTNATPFAWLGGLGVIRLDATHNSQLTTYNSRFGQLYLTRHRLYSPVLRRFLSADPLGIAGGLNLYAYANGNPIAYIDPLGLCASDSDWGMRIGDFFEMIGNGLSTAGGNLARGVDGTWNLALELMASNPNFRNAGVQNAVYQAVVDEWGSPLKRLGAYGEEPIAVEPEIVDALWDLGAAATAYRNLGGRSGTPKGKLETDKITPDRFRRIPNSLPEELTLDEATHGAGSRIMGNKVLGDPRYSGMEKWQHVHVQPDGTKIVIHFIVDPQTGVRTDFKFK